MDILFINKRGLSDDEIEVVKTMSEQYATKIETNYYKAAENVVPKLFVRVKKHAIKPEELRNNYSIHLKIEAPSIIIAASEDDFDLRKALHKTFLNLITEIEHKFKNEKRKRRETRLL